MKLCKVKQCPNYAYRKNYCNKHRIQLARHGQINNRTIYDPNSIIICDSHYEIILYDKNCKEKGKALFDKDDLPKIIQYKWHLLSCGYAAVKTNGKILLMHHLIMGKKQNLEIDHINRNKLDNRKINLRFVSHFINTRNHGLPRHNTSGYVGIYFDKRRNNWYSRFIFKNKIFNLGHFKKQSEAIKVRKKAESRIYANN